MDKKVLIRVCGLQAVISPDGQDEPIEMIIPGEYFYRNGSHYLRFEEIMDETAEPTVNYIKISESTMEVRKKGLVNVHMVFEQGKKNMTYYSTPFGTLQMGIATTGLEFECSENRLTMKVDYSLDMNDELVADCSLSIDASNTVDETEEIF